MNSQEAKRILAAYRLDQPGSADPDLAEALQLAAKDPELAQWIARQSEFNASIQQHLRGIRTPAGVADRILAESKFVRSASWWTHSRLIALAASVALLLGFWLYWIRPPAEDSFETFRQRMVRSALREYRMDIRTNNMAVIREFLSDNQAPADDQVLKELSAKDPIGAGLLSWQGERVSMVCFNSGSKDILFLFIVDRSAVKRPPPPEAEFKQVSKLMTASWSQRGKAYLLAGTEGVQQFSGEWAEPGRR